MPTTEEKLNNAVKALEGIMKYLAKEHPKALMGYMKNLRYTK